METGGETASSSPRKHESGLFEPKVYKMTFRHFLQGGSPAGLFLDQGVGLTSESLLGAWQLL